MQCYVHTSSLQWPPIGYHLVIFAGLVWTLIIVLVGPPLIKSKYNQWAKITNPPPERYPHTYNKYPDAITRGEHVKTTPSIFLSVRMQTPPREIDAIFSSAHYIFVHAHHRNTAIGLGSILPVSRMLLQLIYPIRLSYNPIRSLHLPGKMKSRARFQSGRKMMAQITRAITIVMVI